MPGSGTVCLTTYIALLQMRTWPLRMQLLRHGASSYCLHGVFAFCQVCHFPRIPLTHPQPALHPQPHSPMHTPLLWQTPHHPYPAASTALPNPPKQALHPPHTSLIQPPAVAASSIQRTHPRFARVTGHHQVRFWSCKLTPEPKFAGECAVAPLSGRFLLVLTEARAVSIGR